VRGLFKVNARRTPDPETVNELLARAEEIENAFAAKIAAKIRGVYGR